MYKINKFTVAGNECQVLVRIADNAFIPFAPDNTDYQAYLLWCSEGNTPLPADEPVAE